MRTWVTLSDSCWTERATKQAPFFTQMSGHQDGEQELLLRPKSQQAYGEITEDWEGTAVFWPPAGDPDPWATEPEQWLEAQVVAVDVPEDEGDAPSIYVRAEHPIDYATLDRIKPANGLNVGHREFDFYAPLTDWVDAWTTAAPAEPPDAWYAARVRETTSVPAWSEAGLIPEKARAMKVQRHRLSVIWGPPGTGKTYTIGHLVARRMAAEPTLRVLVLSISNRAVDIAALAVDDAWETVAPKDYPPNSRTLVRARAPVHERMLEARRGHLMRGYADTVEPFKKRRAEILDALFLLAGRRAEATARLKLREELKSNTDAMNDALKKLLATARCVFATVNHALHSPAIELSEFGLIVIDEAGFVPAASFAAVAASSTGSVLVAGDFQQLPPIVNFHPKDSTNKQKRRWPTRTFRGKRFDWVDDEQARKQKYTEIYSWFGETVFDMLGVADRDVGRDEAAATARANATAEGWFATLTEQRRMPAAVCSFVAAQTYGGQNALRTVTAEPTKAFLTAIDDTNAPLLWVNVEGHTAMGPASRLKNDATAEGAAKLAVEGAQKGASVRVLTRYNAQARLIRKVLERYKDTHKAEVLGRIAVSTVHRAQGDEADLVIFDPIHTRPFHATGDIGWRNELRLCNVIVSRSQGQVVLFLHPSYVNGGETGEPHTYFQGYMRAGKELKVDGLAPKPPYEPRRAPARPFRANPRYSY